MFPSSKNSDVGIGASSWENTLFWTDNAKYSVEYDFNVSQQFFVEHSWHSQMQQSVFHINDEHSGKMTRWVNFINALVLPFPQLPSARVVSLDPCIGFFQMMGPWTIHFAHLSGYRPVGCGNASWELIELQPCCSKQFLSSHFYYDHTASVLIRWRCQTMLSSLRHKYLTLQN